MLAPIILKHRFGVHRGGCAGAARVSNKGQRLPSIVRRDEQDRKARRIGGRTCFWRSMDFSLTAGSLLWFRLLHVAREAEHATELIVRCEGKSAKAVVCGTEKRRENLWPRMSKPKRIQRSRAKGWKMPAKAIYVGRPTVWGNPYGEREKGVGPHY
jgi:hypothetical protein